MKIDYIDGFRLKQAAIAGARRVIMMQENLNRINVFPVADNDTGTNMALTMQSVAEGAISCREKSVSLMSQCLADSALMGARGNSGAILAQFFQGFAEHVRGRSRMSLRQFGEAAEKAKHSSYEAITEPKEGTILTVIHDWADRVKKHCHETNDFLELLREGLHAAQQSLKETPKKLKLLSKAGVVDAGAQGFVHMLEGINQFIHTGKIDRAVGFGGNGIASRARVQKAPEKITFQYCTECFITGELIERQTLRNQLSDLGNSLIVAGSSEKVRVHIHTNEPERVFEIAGTFGNVSKQKYDDMRLQHQNAYGENHQSSIGLVTDSSCDLPADFIIRHNIQVVPVQLSFGRENYIDRITITPKEFYHKLEESEEYPKTSQPTPGDFKTAYDGLKGHCQDVLSIHLSGAVSGTLQAAQTAARSTVHEKIKVVDGKNASVALGLVVAEAANAIRDGLPFDKVVEKSQWAIENVRFYVSFSTVEYLIRGGRLSRSRGVLAKLLNLKPILSLDADGKAIRVAQAISDKQAALKIMNFVKKGVVGKRNLKFAVAHSNALNRANWFAEQLRNHFDTADIIIVNVSPALGAHAGPGAAGVAFLGE